MVELLELVVVELLELVVVELLELVVVELEEDELEVEHLTQSEEH